MRKRLGTFDSFVRASMLNMAWLARLREVCKRIPRAHRIIVRKFKDGQSMLSLGREYGLPKRLIEGIIRHYMIMQTKRRAKR